MKLGLAIVGAGLLASCAAYQPREFVSYPHQVGAQEYHRCTNGNWCAEGYSCSRFGCEWCGGGSQTPCQTAGADNLIP
jgi:hypothetical protein